MTLPAILDKSETSRLVSFGSWGVGETHFPFLKLAESRRAGSTCPQDLWSWDRKSLEPPRHVGGQSQDFGQIFCEDAEVAKKPDRRLCGKRAVGQERRSSVTEERGASEGNTACWGGPLRAGGLCTFCTFSFHTHVMQPYQIDFCKCNLFVMAE